MTNTETMQLDLFNGVVLTTKQQEQIDSFINNQSIKAVQTQEFVSKTMLLLDEAGFVQGVDYNSDFEVYEVTKKREFGYSKGGDSIIGKMKLSVRSLIYILKLRFNL